MFSKIDLACLFAKKAPEKSEKYLLYQEESITTEQLPQFEFETVKDDQSQFNETWHGLQEIDGTISEESKDELMSELSMPRPISYFQPSNQLCDDIELLDEDIQSSDESDCED